MIIALPPLTFVSSLYLWGGSLSFQVPLRGSCSPGTTAQCGSETERAYPIHCEIMDRDNTMMFPLPRRRLIPEAQHDPHHLAPSVDPLLLCPSTPSPWPPFFLPSHHAFAYPFAYLSPRVSYASKCPFAFVGCSPLGGFSFFSSLMSVSSGDGALSQNKRRAPLSRGPSPPPPPKPQRRGSAENVSRM